MNKLNTAKNAEQHSLKLLKIVGDYKLNNIYDTLKTRKQNYHPTIVISQILTPVHQ